ncbi:hypothetical protein OHA70_25620 [Kribbella sp. NBC_00382]|uniref:hypothetical protein n=1 Tax=Kribbella sp. NBC_00382 TaxID=2975967 RepID=UPI002E1A71D6
MDLDTAAIELYGLTPNEFTAARNQLAKNADGATAAAIRALRKPTLAAWLANLLVRTDPNGVNDLTELGEALRAAHLSADGAQLRALTPKRHALIKQLVTSAKKQAKQLGRTVTPSVTDRLTETLDAALIDPGAALLLRSGQLTSALRHIGFGVIDETGHPAKLPPIKPRAVRSTPAKKATKVAAKPAPSRTGQTLQRHRAELQARTEKLETDYREAEQARTEAESALDATQHHAADLQTTIDRLTDELEHARRQLQSTQRDATKLERTLNRATHTAAIAQRRRDTHHQRLATFNN